MTYKITKLKIKEGKSSGVRAGHSSTGDFHIGRIDENDLIEMIKDPKLSSVKLDDMVLVYTSIINMTKTSPISEITEQSDDVLKFETGSSIYEIEKIDDSI